MSSYLVANYDANEKVVKLWSTHGELARSVRMEVALTNVTLTVKATDREIEIDLNGMHAISYTLQENEPLSGRFGLNVFSAKVHFKKLGLTKENYEYTSGELAVDLQINQYVREVINLTTGNTRLEPGYYRQTSDTLYIKESYFALLENGLYRFKIVGVYSTIYINVEVNMTHQLVINDVEIDAGLDVRVYVGNTAITSVSVNNTVLDESKYSVRDYVLTIDSSCFEIGDNEVVVNGNISFTVKVNDVLVPIKPSSNKSGCGGSVIATSIILSTLALCGASALIIRKNKGE